MSSRVSALSAPLRLRCGLVAIAAVAALSGGTATAAPVPGTSAGFGWEWVSTVDTLGRGVTAGILGSSTSRALLLDEDNLVWQPFDPFEDATSGAADAYISTRTASGWKTSRLSPSRADNRLYQLLDVAGDGRTMAFLTSSAVWAGPGRRAPRSIARRDPDGGFTEVAGVSATGFLDYIGMSDDGAATVYSASEAPAGMPATDGVAQVYTTDRAGVTEPVAVDGNGAPLSVCPDGSHALETEQTAVSEDARTVLFASQGAECDSQTGIWARRGGRTISVVPPSAAFEGTPVLLGMRPDGSSAYVQSPAGLTPDDTNGGEDIYRADLAVPGTEAVLDCITCELSVRPDAPSVSANGTLVFRATDLSAFGFRTERVYGYDGATLQELYGGPQIVLGDPGELLTIKSKLDLSPDGRTVLAFLRTVGGVELRRIRWGGSDAPTENCVSCRSDGTPSAVLYPFNDQRPGHDSSPLNRPQSMSADGRSIVFASGDALADGATPRDPGAGSGLADAVVNVYRWKQDASPQVTFLGRVKTSTGPLAAVDDSGNSVFLTLDDPVAAQAAEAGVTSSEWYVARIGGGFPLPPSSACDGEACRPGPVPDPVLPIGRSGLGGPGNAATPPAEKPADKIKAARPRAARGSALTLTVRAPEAGRISVSGTGLRPTRVVVTKAGEQRVELRLSAAGKRTLARKRRLRSRAMVRFVPRTGAGSSTRVAVTFLAAKKRALRAGTHAGTPTNEQDHR